MKVQETRKEAVKVVREEERKVTVTGGPLVSESASQAANRCHICFRCRLVLAGLSRILIIRCCNYRRMAWGIGAPGCMPILLARLYG